MNVRQRATATPPLSPPSLRQLGRCPPPRRRPPPRVGRCVGRSQPLSTCARSTTRGERPCAPLAARIDFALAAHGAHGHANEAVDRRAPGRGVGTGWGGQAREGNVGDKQARGPGPTVGIATRHRRPHRRGGAGAAPCPRLLRRVWVHQRPLTPAAWPTPLAFEPFKETLSTSVAFFSIIAWKGDLNEEEAVVAAI